MDFIRVHLDAFDVGKKTACVLWPPLLKILLYAVADDAAKQLLFDAEWVCIYVFVHAWAFVYVTLLATHARHL